MSGEKTEKPTPKRLREARKEGRIARTPDLSAWGGILAATVLLPMVGSRVSDQVSQLVVQSGEVIRNPDVGTVLSLAKSAFTATGVDMLLMAVPLLLLGLALHTAQGGLHFATKAAKPQAKRLNPLPGLKRMFGPHSAWEAIKQTSKTAVLGLLLWHAVSTVVPLLVGSGHLPLPAVLQTCFDALLTLMRWAAVTGLVLAGADYMVAKRRIGKQVKMTLQEVKDEHKQSEGDPQMKGAIRSRQMAISRNRMIADVKQADVVLVNPTHVAVALKYQPERGAPRVVAKGAGVIARRIRETATEARVPLVADIPLARALYKACDVGQEIPSELYTVVARVLAFVLSLKSRGSAAGTHRLPAQRQMVAAGQR